MAIHRDDVAIDCTGNNSIAGMKATRRFRLIKHLNEPRIISTTDRILHVRADHHLPRKILTKAYCKLHFSNSMDVELSETSRMLEKPNLFSCGSEGSSDSIAVPEFTERETSYAITEIVKGGAPSKGQRAIYIDGAFNFSTPVTSRFWEAVMYFERTSYADLEPYLIISIYDDTTESKCKGISFPVINMMERA